MSLQPHLNHGWPRMKAFIWKSGEQEERLRLPRSDSRALPMNFLFFYPRSSVSTRA